MTIDNAQLAQVVQHCFVNSMDGRFSPADQDRFLQLGQKLRVQLTDLLAAQFNANTAEVVSANKQISAVNQQLSNAVQTLANVASILTSVAQVAAALDGLINLASKVAGV